MEIDENKIYASRFIEFIQKISVESSGDPRTYLRVATFIVLLKYKNEFSEEKNRNNYIIAKNRYTFSDLTERAISPNSEESQSAMGELLNLYARENPSLLKSVSFDSLKIPISDYMYIVNFVEKLSTAEGGSDLGRLESLFHYLVDYCANKSEKYDRNIINALSVFSSSIFAHHISEIVEYFPFSADPILEFSNQITPPPLLVFDSPPKGFEFEYWMRSAMCGASILGFNRTDRFRKIDQELSLSVIDPVFAPPKSSKYWKQYFHRPSKDFGLPIDFIVDKAESHEAQDYSVLAVPARDISKGGYFSEGMRRIVEKRCVLAVIDIPKGKKSRANWSIWVLRNVNEKAILPYRSDKILFVSADILEDLTFAPENHQIYLFASFIIKQFIFPHRTVDPQYDLKPGFLEFYNNLFHSGYKDVEGLCKLASFEEVEENDFKLSAKHYVEPAKSDRHSHGVDFSVLSKALDDNRGRGSCYFLIGDNGQGKSVALSKLADSYSREGRLALAISFGVMDRFSYERKGKSSNINYRYLGGRTSKSGMSAKDLSSEIAKRLISTEDEKRKRLFIKLASSVGFSADYFLIPHLNKGTSISRYTNLGDIISIFSDSPRDEELLASYIENTDFAKNSFQLGLKRQRESSTIVPFSDLSSGEQQILNLLSKIVFNAEEESIVFVDEPEISLHVSWQRAVPKLLYRVSEEFNCDVVVATHSPIIISEAMVIECKCFSARNRVISSMDSVEKNSIEAVLFECFKTNTVNNREINEKCASLLSDAIKWRNSSAIDQRQGPGIMEQLDKMESVITESMVGKDDSVKSALNIIDKTRKAINEVLFMPFEEPDEEWGQ